MTNFAINEKVLSESEFSDILDAASKSGDWGPESDTYSTDFLLDQGCTAEDVRECKTYTFYRHGVKNSNTIFHVTVFAMKGKSFARLLNARVDFDIGKVVPNSELQKELESFF